MPRVILLGSANAGKSSLFNALVGETGALVSDEPGTTRDYLVAELSLDGLRCRLIDTAGTDAADATHTDSIAAAAQAAASDQARQGQLRLFCIDGARVRAADEPPQSRDGDRIVVLTKADLPQAVETPPGAIATSSVTGLGLAALRLRIRQALWAGSGQDLRVASGTAARCRQSLCAALEGLRRTRSVFAAGLGEELAAAELRTALMELGRVVGEVYTDEILDSIFSRFCVGK